MTCSIKIIQSLYHSYCLTMKVFVNTLCILLVAVCLSEALNEDQLLDQLHYNTNIRSRRALCDQPAPVTAIPFDPSCRYCSCFSYPYPYPSPVLSKRVILPINRCTNYALCCRNKWPSVINSGASAAKASVSDSSINQMASSLINKFGKRASDNQFKKPSVDLVFLLDDSGSIPSAQFQIAKEGAATLSQALCPKSYGSAKGEKQVSVVLFSTTSKTVISFEESQKGAGFLENAILNIKQRSGATATTDAIQHVREKVLRGPGSRLDDPETASIVFVITDGKCNNGCNKLAEEAKKLREAGPGVQVFAFGVGEADCNELELIRGKEAGEVFGLPDFNFFEKLAIAVKEQMVKNGNACVN